MCSFNEHRIKRKSYEIICARGKLRDNSRPIFIIAVYLSTKLKAEQYHECLELIFDAILRIKSENNSPYLLVLVDFNNKDIGEAIGDYGDFSVYVTRPTRGNKVLDIAASSFNSEIHNATVMSPLLSEEGTASDHGVIVYTAFLKHRHCFEWIRYSRRKMTPAGRSEFDKCMRGTDWDAILS